MSDNLLQENNSKILQESGFTLLLVRAWSMVASTGAYTLTGFDTAFKKAWKMVMDSGSYVLTGIDIGLFKMWKMVLSAGSYTLTGIDVLFHKAWKLIAVTVSYVLTGNDLIIKGFDIIVNITKPVSTMINQIKTSLGIIWGVSYKIAQESGYKLLQETGFAFILEQAETGTSILTTWGTETATWNEVSQLFRNPSRPITSIVNQLK